MIDEHGTLLPLMSDYTKRVIGSLLFHTFVEGDFDQVDVLMHTLGIEEKYRHQIHQELAAIAVAFANVWTREDRERGSRSWS